MQDTRYAVETFSLTKVFTDWWGRNKVFAVDNLNLQVRFNEVFGLLGPNGSGKTTILKMLLSLLHPTKGRSLVLGGDSRDPKISGRVGFLPEESYLYKYLTARETLDFYGKLFGLAARVRRHRIETLLEMVGLQAVANRRVGTFSKGMARRIGLAQALINDPDLLILDEPTTGLDPIGTRQIKDLILHLAKRGKTVLLCSHLLADVEDICDRIAILYGGRMQMQGQVAELLQQTDKKQIITSRLSNDAVQRIRNIVESEQAQCEITSPMDKLETFFIKVVQQAQRTGQPTSGALGTTQISGFLAAKASAKSILDKLVQAPASAPQPPQPQPVKAESIPPAQSTPDDELLRKLTRGTPNAKGRVWEPTQTPAPVETEPVGPCDSSASGRSDLPDAEPPEANTNILDELTDSPGSKPEQTDKSGEGDTQNA